MHFVDNVFSLNVDGSDGLLATILISVFDLEALKKENSHEAVPSKLGNFQLLGLSSHE
jgi:hypothetical protein